jgi:hypothetical protein
VPAISELIVYFTSLLVPNFLSTHVNCPINMFYCQCRPGFIGMLIKVDKIRIELNFGAHTTCTRFLAFYYFLSFFKLVEFLVATVHI